jgi:hypothetical protein
MNVDEILSAKDQDPSLFVPAPDSWKQMLKVAMPQRRYWQEAMRKEVSEVIKKGTFVKSEPQSGDPIIPVTVKFRVKLNSEGTVDKLKARMAYRGDLQREANITDNTWCQEWWISTSYI